MKKYIAQELVLVNDNKYKVGVEGVVSITRSRDNRLVHVAYTDDTTSTFPMSSVRTIRNVLDETSRD